jgi:transposase InsO family protein
MCASDVTATLDQALSTSGLDHTTAVEQPRLLSDNGSSYVADDLAKWLKSMKSWNSCNLPTVLMHYNHNRG